MITEESVAESAPRDPREIRDVTIDILKDYLSEIEIKHGDMICPTCHGNIWNIPVSPNDPKHPNVITLPMPLNKGYGVWAFHIICDQCGQMKFFEAATTVDSLRRQEKI